MAKAMKQTQAALTTEQEELAQRIYQRLRSKMDDELLAMARLMASKADHEIFVAGSMSPLEDCYSPELVPSDGELWIEHAEMARDLAGAGCDLLLVETMNTIREAVPVSLIIRSANSRIVVSAGLPRLTGPTKPSADIIRTRPSTRSST